MNNKRTRKHAEKLASQVFTQQADGTEVLKSKESRVKQRRWTFEADISIVIPATENLPVQKMPMRTVHLESVSYGSVKDARLDCVRHAEFLKNTNKMFETAEIKVRAVPHETISNETMRQLMGYRDMSVVLDKALDMAICEASDVALGKSAGSQFVEILAAKPERTTASIKQEFYERAMKELSPKESADAAESNPGSDQIEPTNEGASNGLVITDVGEEKQPFTPEIVDVQRAAETCQTT